MQNLREKRRARSREPNRTTDVTPRNEPPSKGDLTANMVGFVVWLGAFVLVLFIAILLVAT